MTAVHRRWRDEESRTPPRLRIALYVVPQLVGWFSPSASASLAREIADARRQHKAIRNSPASPDFPFSIRDTQGSRNRRNPLKTNNGGHFYSRQKRTPRGVLLRASQGEQNRNRPLHERQNLSLLGFSRQNLVLSAQRQLRQQLFERAQGFQEARKDEGKIGANDFEAGGLQESTCNAGR